MPMPTPVSDTTPVGTTPTPPTVDVVAYPDLPPPALPASVETWKNAVVAVSVELASGRTRDQQGLVVSDGAVLTMLDITEEIASLSVKVSGRDTYPAELERFDPRTGAALLSVDAEGLAVAPGESTTIAPGEPVLMLSRDQDGELVLEETYASPSLNAPYDLFALLSSYTLGTQRGTVVVTADGTPLGVAGHGRRWYGRKVVWGRLPGPDLPVVMLDSGLRLLELGPPDAGITPAAVVYHGPTSGHADGPVTRDLLAEPVQATLKDLGQPVPVENLGRHPRYVLRPPRSGVMLELLYATPQELLGANGKLLGSAQFVVLWWAREGGAPDLVLCGTDREHLGAAFATNGLDTFEELMEGAPSSSPHSMVAAAPLPKDGYSGEDYQYPYGWDLKPDKPAYAQDELVTLTFTVTNISDWPVPLDYLPPRVTIRSVQEHRDVAVLGYGDEHRVVQPGETASFTMTWDQMHFEGGRATPGRYVAQVQLADLVTNRWLDPGPKAYEVILE